MNTLLFNFREQSERFFFSFITVLLQSIILPLCHTYSFHVVSLFLSLPISLCSFYKCLSLSALSPHSLCVSSCLPLRNRICGNVLICGALVQSCQSAMSRNTNLTPGNYGPFFSALQRSPFPHLCCSEDCLCDPSSTITFSL